MHSGPLLRYFPSFRPACFEHILEPRVEPFQDWRSIHMQRKCPNCGSTEVRRSGDRDLGEPSRTMFRSRYHCRSCRRLFWVISARTYRVAGLLVGVGLLAFAVIAVFVPG